MKITKTIASRALNATVALSLAARPAWAASLVYEYNDSTKQLIAWDGDGTHARISPCASGDFNGDGVPDLAMASEGLADTLGRSDNGAVWVVYGPFPSDPVPRWLNQAQYFNFRVDGRFNGDNIDACDVQDINNDGKEDLLVRPADADTFWAFYGPLPSGTGNTCDLNATTPCYSLRVTINDAEDLFWDFEDLNGDDVPDMLLESPSADVNGVDAGALYIVWGGSGLIPASGTGNVLDLSNTSNFHVRLQGNSASDWFTTQWGWASKMFHGDRSYGLGDINGDGIKDLAVPAPLEDTQGRTDNSSVYVTTGPWPSSTGNIWTMSGTRFMVRYDGPQTSQHVTRALIADLSGDGQDDLCMQSTYQDVGVGDNGAVWCKKGPISVSAGSIVDLATNANWDVRFDDQNDSIFLGFSGLFAVDLNDDGVKDLAMATPYFDAVGWDDTGGMFVVYGGASFPFGSAGTVRSFATTTNYNVLMIGGSGQNFLFGSRPLFRDLDGDGILDIVAHGFNINNAEACNSWYTTRGYVFFGPLPNGNGVLLRGDQDAGIRWTYSDCARMSMRGTVMEDFDRNGYPEAAASWIFRDANGLPDSGRVVIRPWEPQLPKITAPGPFTGQTSPTVQWNAVSGASSYRVVVDEDPLFLTPVFDQVVGTNQANLSGLSNGVTYYARVRPVNGDYTRWGPVYDFTVDTTAPTAPTLSAPGDATGTHPAVDTQTPTFDWSEASTE